MHFGKLAKTSINMLKIRQICQGNFYAASLKQFTQWCFKRLVAGLTRGQLHVIEMECWWAGGDYYDYILIVIT